MNYNTAPLVLRTGVRASWLPGDPSDRFWYRVTTEKGVEAVLVDPGKASKASCDLRAVQGGGARGGGPRRRRRRQICGDVAGSQAHRFHPRLEPVGARCRQRPRDAADQGRRQRFRLRHRQRRLGAQRSADPPLVARLEEDRHLPAGSARRRRNVSGGHHRRPSRAAGVEVSAARRRDRHDDSARRHRRGHRKDRPAEAATGSASLHAVRRRGVPRRMG